MPDYFALLHVPRQPWLDVEALKERFLALSVDVHPDRVHAASETERQAANERFAELNAAYNCLREPVARLRHLLELERGTKLASIERVPAGTMELFMQVGNLCRKVDAFLKEKDSVDSPLLKARIFESGLDWMDKLNALLAVIHQKEEQLNDDLKAMPPYSDEDQAANEEASLPTSRIEEIYRMMSYYARWGAQIRERLVQLSF